MFVGVHQEAELPLRFLVDQSAHLVGLVTLREAWMGKVSGAMDLEPIVRPHGIPVLRVRSINHANNVRWIAGRRPDLLLVVGWTQLLKDPLLRLPTIASLGFHASLLPKYRGRAPINWALINDEKKTGNTMIVLAPGADEGDIVAQREFAITDEDDCKTLYDKVSASEVDMLGELLENLRSGVIPRRKQADSDATVMPKRTPEDGEIDWSWSTRRIFNWVRAQTHPYPGAFTWGNGSKIRVWKVRPAKDPELDSSLPIEPGVVTRADDRAVVRTGDGWLELLRVQRQGDEESPGADVLDSWLAFIRRFERGRSRA